MLFVSLRGFASLGMGLTIVLIVLDSTSGIASYTLVVPDLGMGDLAGNDICRTAKDQ